MDNNIKELSGANMDIDLVSNNILTNDNKTVDFDSWDYYSVKDLEHDKAIQYYCFL